MSAALPCPRCDSPRGDDESCPDCGYDADLAGRNYRGEDADLGDEEDEDYADFLAREGLSADPGRGRLLAVIAIVVAVGLALAWLAGRSA